MCYYSYFNLHRTDLVANNIVIQKKVNKIFHTTNTVSSLFL